MIKLACCLSHLFTASLLHRIAQVGPGRVRWADGGVDAYQPRSMFDAGNQEVTIGLVIRMLQLASAALREVSARRVLVMQSVGERAIIQHGVAWKASYLAIDRMRMFCEFDADSGEQLRDAMRSAEIRFARVWPALKYQAKPYAELIES